MGGEIMAREITGTRDYLLQINEKYPDKELLSKTDVYRYLGISRNTLKKLYPELWESQYTSKLALAKLLAKRCLQ